MRIICRATAIALVVMAMLRAGLFALYAWHSIRSPLEAYYIEATFVHACRSFQTWDVLYPPYQHFPYVANFYGPIYPAIVGALGRVSNAALFGLFVIGRLVTLISAIGTSVAIAACVRHRYGLAAATIAALFSIGSLPTIGFLTMVRPDALAELLGFVGFLCAMRERPKQRMFAVLLLAAAILTKQTAGVFVIAATIVRLLGRQWRAAASLAIGSTVCVALVVLPVQWLAEPHFWQSLVGQTVIPWDSAHGRKIVSLVAGRSPELFVLSFAGLILWLRRTTRDVPLASLAAVLVSAGLVTCFKFGSDSNYFLGMRLIAALAAGATWRLLSDYRLVRPARGFVLAVLAATLFVPSLVVMYLEAKRVRQDERLLAAADGRNMLADYRRLFSLAGREDIRLLTDVPIIAVHQHDRAAFLDPYLFRALVQSGRIRPSRLVEIIAAKEFDLVVLTAELGDPLYDRNSFALPIAIADAVREHYRLERWMSGFFVYVPQNRSTGPFFP